jgi:hypothetical protein
MPAATIALWEKSGLLARKLEDAGLPRDAAIVSVHSLEELVAALRAPFAAAIVERDAAGPRLAEALAVARDREAFVLVVGSSLAEAPVFIELGATACVRRDLSAADWAPRLAALFAAVRDRLGAGEGRKLAAGAPHSS